MYPRLFWSSFFSIVIDVPHSSFGQSNPMRLISASPGLVAQLVEALTANPDRLISSNPEWRSSQHTSYQRRWQLLIMVSGSFPARRRLHNRDYTGGYGAVFGCSFLGIVFRATSISAKRKTSLWWNLYLHFTQKSASRLTSSSSRNWENRYRHFWRNFDVPRDFSVNVYHFVRPIAKEFSSQNVELI